MKLGDFVRDYRIAHDLSQRQFALICGVSNGTISNLESGINPNTGKPITPTMDLVKKLATAMCMTMTELMTVVDDMPIYITGEQDDCSADINDVIKIGDDVIAVGGKPVSVTGRAGAGKSRLLIDNIIPMPQMRKVPLIGSIACGAPILAEEHIEEYIDIPKHISADFALTCKGDSMINARIFDGDIVYIRQQDTVDNGEIAAVLIDTEATLKRVQLFEDHISLEPENPQYRPLVYWGEDMNNVRILGKAMAFTSAIR